jgi:hypothetical protein
VRDDVEAVAGLIFREEQLAGSEVFAHRTCCKHLKLRARQAGEKRGLFEDGYQFSAGRRHGEEFIARPGRLASDLFSAE